MSPGQAIPRQVALKLCEEIRTENRNKRFSPGGLQCFFCYRWARGDEDKLCLSNKNGCNLINQRYQP